MSKKKIVAGVMAAAVVTTAGFVVARDNQVSISSVSPGLSDKRAALLDSHNDKRASKCGRNLQHSQGLADAALYHADDMVDEGYFSHNSANPYESWANRIDRFTGYQVGGENIAHGYSTVSTVMSAWMASTGHKANIMNCSFTRVGFGYAQNSSGSSRRWVADFAY